MLLSSDNILWKQKVAEIASFSSLSVEEVIQLCDQYHTTDFKAVHRNQDSKDFWKKLYVRFKLMRAICELLLLVTMTCYPKFLE